MQAPDSEALRHRLVHALRANGSVRSAAVHAAMCAVPRELFVPADTDLDEAYADRALVLTTENGGRPTSSISQPSMIALMLEQLGARPGHRVLEVGTASGYTAALLDRMIGPTGTVLSLEFDGRLAAAAAERLAGSFPVVRVVHADGWLGALRSAPFDRVHVTVGVDDLSPAWLGQLASDGVLVVPLTLRPGLELSVGFLRNDRCLTSMSVTPCGFVRIRGPHATDAHSVPLTDGAVLVADWLTDADADRLRPLLDGPENGSVEVGTLPPGWSTRITLDQPEPLVLIDGSRLHVHHGLHDPHTGGVALVREGWLIGYGHPSAARTLRRLLRTTPPLPPSRLRVIATPTGQPTPDTEWVVRKQHFVYGVSPP